MLGAADTGAWRTALGARSRFAYERTPPTARFQRAIREVPFVPRAPRKRGCARFVVWRRLSEDNRLRAYVKIRQLIHQLRASASFEGV